MSTPGVEQRPPTPTLEDCSEEPIHIPGAVQPHGVLFVFEQGKLVAWSSNAAARLGAQPRLGSTLEELGLGPELIDGVREALDSTGDGDGVVTALYDAFSGGQQYARLVHRHDGRVLLEFELRSEVIHALVASLTSAEEPLRALFEHEAALRRLLRAEGIVLAWQGKVVEAGGISHETALLVTGHMLAQNADLLALSRREEWPEPLRGPIGEWVGALDIEFDRLSRGHIILLRREQIMTVRWGGNPDKVVQTGPNGPRLTPRGSCSTICRGSRGRATPKSRRRAAT